MMIVIAYCDEPLAVLTYNSTFPKPSGSTGEQLALLALVAHPKKLDIDTVSGTTLCGRKYSVKKHGWYNHAFVFSSDQIDLDSIPFFEAFWAARYKYISRYSDDSEGYGDYVRVETPGGELPVDYIEGVSELPEIELLLNEVEPI